MAHRIKLTTEQKILFDALTKLQQKFVLGILNGLNQTEAYKQAGGKAKSDDTAYAQASRMISFDKVKSFLDEMNAEAISDAVMTRQEALERLSTMGRTSLSNLAEFGEYVVGADDDGNPIVQATWKFKDSALQDPNAMSAIAELVAGKDGIKIKMHDPKAAIKQLADMQGWEAPKKTELTGAEGGPIEIKSISDEELSERLRELGYGRKSNQLDSKVIAEESGDAGSI
ncbi:terminase small subunit [Budvicia aquatica]|uniref:Terminase small subunit n=1 Tax=Budvicia aquatica TaxID=82979 RepID=A0A2C6DGS7_9GAMM|nr:terminase small subunit [Budvicia aquatica]PHI29498.1 terminase small subunit [Budvicia aquatica]VFS47795.1 Terminase small subunit [Budvicia aquatica]